MSIIEQLCQAEKERILNLENGNKKEPAFKKTNKEKLIVMHNIKQSEISLF